MSKHISQMLLVSVHISQLPLKDNRTGQTYAQVNLSERIRLEVFVVILRITFRAIVIKPCCRILSANNPDSGKIHSQDK